MAITRGKTQEYVLPNGRIDFALWPNINGSPDRTKAKGYRYLGASTEFNLTQENETLEHKSSECGFNTTDEEIIISSKLSGSLTVDNINVENLALFFAGEVLNEVQSTKSSQHEVFKVYKGMGYRIGQTSANPNGVFSVTVSAVKTYANETDADNDSSEVETLVKDTDYEVDEKHGYIMFGESANIAAEGTWVRVAYSIADAKREVVITRGQSVVGSLLFRGCNARGENRMYYMPKVQLTASGDFALKGGEEWATMSFDVTALKAENEAMLYINGVPTTT